MNKQARVIYSHSLTGGGLQLMLDEDDSAALIKRIALREGQVITEFLLDIAGETIEVVALTPDTLLPDERQAIEQLIQNSYEFLLDTKRIILHG